MDVVKLVTTRDGTTFRLNTGFDKEELDKFI